MTPLPWQRCHEHRGGLSGEPSGLPRNMGVGMARALAETCPRSRGAGTVYEGRFLVENNAARTWPSDALGLSRAAERRPARWITRSGLATAPRVLRLACRPRGNRRHHARDAGDRTRNTRGNTGGHCANDSVHHPLGLSSLLHDAARHAIAGTQDATGVRSSANVGSRSRVVRGMNASHGCRVSRRRLHA